MDFLSVSVESSLPKLSWMAKVEKAGVRLICGTGVVVGKGQAGEGVWLGDEYIFGSKIKLTKNGLNVFPPTHTCEGVYVVFPFKGRAMYVTNSLIWALKEGGVKKSTKMQSVTSSLITSTRGVLAYTKDIFTSGSATVLRFLYNNFHVTENSVNDSPLSLPEFYDLSFISYKKSILKVLNCVFNKASIFGFNRQVCTISSGYDSVAASALCKELGVNNYLTLKTNSNDSGLGVGRQMGLDVKEFDRPGDGYEYFSAGAYYVDFESMEVPHDRGCEILSCLSNPGDLVLSPFSEDLRGAVFVSGFHGDKVWDYYCNSGPWIKRGDSSGSALSELRLSLGFVHIPLPYILCRNSVGLKRLTQSREMKFWSYNNPYNRPIPRRIGEDAGALRESFGMKKLAANFGIKLPNGIVNEAFDYVASRYSKSF